jgi:hypothetical protein
MKNLTPQIQIEIIGKVIRQALLDYRSASVKKYHRIVWNDAKDFLFGSGRLEDFLIFYGLDESLNCDYIRQQADASKDIFGKYEVPFDLPEDYDE